MAFACLSAERHDARARCWRVVQGIALVVILCSGSSVRAQGKKQSQPNPSPTYLAEKSPSDSIRGISNWVASGAPRVELQGGKHDIVILFDKAAAGISSSSEVRYRLVGYDADWQNTNSRAAHYN